MSQLSIRNALLGQVITTLTPIVGADNIAFENKDFNPTGLDEWCGFRFNPATSESLGKTSASSDDERGFAQINVYIKINALDFDSRQLEIIDDIKKDFYYGVSFSGVDILEVTTNQGFTSESWYVRTVTINYLSYQSRV